MSEALAGHPDTTEPPGSGSGGQRRARAAIAAAVVVVMVIVVAVAAAGGSSEPPAGAANVVPADALAYASLSLDRSPAPVARALALARRFPDFGAVSTLVPGRLTAILADGHSVAVSRQITPWLGSVAAVALLNTATSTAGALIVLDVRSAGRARAFVRAEGAGAAPSYRGTAIEAYPSGTQLAFVSHYLVVGRADGVRAAIDVGAGRTPSLAGSGVYRRAVAGLPSRSVLSAYASLAGVQRVLVPRSGVIGAVGGLLSEPALQGVALGVVPVSGGAQIVIHRTLDPLLARLRPTHATAFTPALQNVLPSGALMMLDVAGLADAAPAVLRAGATAGIAARIGPLLTRLGTALTAEGVNVHRILSIFAGETAVAIVPGTRSPTLVVVTRVAHPTQVRAELASLEIPLAQLFQPPSNGSGQVPQFNDLPLGAGVSDHQLDLANGLQLNYTVVGNLVVISTSQRGVASVVARTRTLATDPGFRAAFDGSRPGRVTALAYLELPQLLALARQTGFIGVRTFARWLPDLDHISGVGLTSTRSADSATTRLTLRVR